MNRLKLTMPTSWQWTKTFEIPIYFVNYGGHMGNDSFLQLLHEARILFLQSLGFTELNIDGTALIMADAQLTYKAELKQGDVVRVSIACLDFDRLGFDIYYLVQKVNGGQLTTALEAKTGMMGFDYSLGKKKGFTEKAVTVLQSVLP